eukprot:TRINITY_DN44484_c0_g1_i1.p1 TRINITY_DN44484_c0_g1~~TRINITY_DN44484_c0_g1_i1.p1  ORF type:complete len:546 (+),score=58.51 TRINITY_DN44484_c0_g1_i1:130-1638(+)
MHDFVGLISVVSPNSMGKSMVAYFASFSRLPLAPISLEVWLPAGDPEGCEGDLHMVPVGRNVVAALRRGTCNFVEKSLRAQAAGARGLIIVDSSDNGSLGWMGIGSQPSKELIAAEHKVDIIVTWVHKTLGESLMNWTRDHPSEPAVISFEMYKPQYGATELVVGLMATTLVAMSTLYATAQTQSKQAYTSVQAQESEAVEEAAEVSTYSAPIFCVAGSAMLLALFFLMNYIVYFVMFSFCILTFFSFLELSSNCLGYYVQQTRKRALSIPLCGWISIAEMLCSLPTVLLVGAWIAFRNTSYGWIPQDILGASLLLTVQNAARVPTLRVATVLLVAMCLFDVFWVFISPLFFGKSVMVTVATGGDSGEHIPMVFRMPAIGNRIASERILGYGDIVIPGLLVTFLRRFDMRNAKSCCDGYFVFCLIAYFCGMLCVFVLLYVMKKGQPALLCLVPSTLGTTLVLGAIRGETCNLWHGTAVDSDSSSEGSESDSVHAPVPVQAAA